LLRGIVVIRKGICPEGKCPEDLYRSPVMDVRTTTKTAIGTDRTGRNTGRQVALKVVCVYRSAILQ